MNLNKIIELVLSWFHRPKKKKRLLSSGDKLHRLLKDLRLLLIRQHPGCFFASSPLAQKFN